MQKENINSKTLLIFKCCVEYLIYTLLPDNLKKELNKHMNFFITLIAFEN
jgi:hypothetical protein